MNQEQEKKPLAFKAPEEADVAIHGGFEFRERLPHVGFVYKDGGLMFMDAITFGAMMGEVMGYLIGSRPPEGHIHQIVVEIGLAHPKGYTIGYGAIPVQELQHAGEESTNGQ